MACITACRKARAWQRQLRALSSFKSLRYDITSSTVFELPTQRFNSTSTSSLPVAAIATADVQPAASAPTRKRSQQKNSKLDKIELLEAAQRIFDMSLGSEEDLNGGEVETDGAGVSSGSSQPVMSSKLVDEYNDMMEALDKKREKIPLMAGETLESWLNKHKEDLQPFLAFLQRHGADQTLIVAHLYRAGYWGRKVMLPPTNDESTRKIAIELENQDIETSNDIQHLPFEKLFSDWQIALKKEDVHLTASDLLQRWPGMLTRPPTNLGTRLAILRAALPEDAGVDVQDLIRRAPMILGIAPLEMQKRLLKLQLVTEGEIQHMLVSCPMLLANSLDDIFSNLRLVREYSRSAREFKSFLHTSASAIEHRPSYLQNVVASTRRALAQVLPPGIDAVELIKAKPQLLLIRNAWYRQRWEAIEDAVQLVDEWKEECKSLLQHCAAMPARFKDTLLSSSFSSPGDFLSPLPPPEWIHKDMDPKSLGVNLNQPKPVLQDIWELDTSSTEDNLNDTVENEDDDATIEAVRNGCKAYSALGEALWMNPWRIQRLEYMAEQVPIEAARVSFVSAMAVTLEQFEERFPEFHDWVKSKQEERDYDHNERQEKEHENAMG